MTPVGAASAVGAVVVGVVVVCIVAVGGVALTASAVCGIVVQAFYGQKLVNLPQIATEANSTDMIS